MILSMSKFSYTKNILSLMSVSHEYFAPWTESENVFLREAMD